VGGGARFAGFRSGLFSGAQRAVGFALADLAFGHGVARGARLGLRLGEGIEQGGAWPPAPRAAARLRSAPTARPRSWVRIASSRSRAHWSHGVASRRLRAPGPRPGGGAPGLHASHSPAKALASAAPGAGLLGFRPGRPQLRRPVVAGRGGLGLCSFRGGRSLRAAVSRASARSSASADRPGALRRGRLRPAPRTGRVPPDAAQPFRLARGPARGAGSARSASLCSIAAASTAWAWVLMALGVVDSRLQLGEPVAGLQADGRCGGRAGVGGIAIPAVQRRRRASPSAGPAPTLTGQAVKIIEACRPRRRRRGGSAGRPAPATTLERRDAAGQARGGDAGAAPAPRRSAPKGPASRSSPSAAARACS
jgi:hypothetical protein